MNESSPPKSIRAIAETLRGRLDALGRSHVPEDLPLDEKRCLYAANLAIPFHLVSTAPYAVLFAIYGNLLLAALVVPLCLSYVGAHLLMRKGRTVAARYLLLLSITFGIFVFCLFLGEPSRLETALFYTVAAPFLFFSAKDASRILLAIVPPVAAYALLHSWGYGWMEPMPLQPWQIELFRNLITATTALLILTPLFFLLRHILSTEAELVRALAQAESSNRAKSQFLGMVSHELRTPLNGLVGAIDLVGSESLSLHQRDNLEIARTTGSLLRTIIGDILEFSRLEEGGIVLERRSSRLQSDIPRMLHLYRMQADNKGLGWRMNIAEDLPRVLVDIDRVRQILLHLLGNAVKFTERGFVEVGVSSGPDRSDGLVEVQILVRDTGVGMSPEQTARLFDPFIQLHRPLNLNAKGTGLGLALAMRVVRAMEGSIEVESKPELGTVVRIRLLLERSIALAASVVDPPPAPCGPPRRILLVEDEPVNRLVATRLLRKEGFEVVTAENGAHCLEICKTEAFPVVLMDCQMPLMDGLAATRALRVLEQIKGRPRSVVIAYTANALAEDRRRCIESGMDGFLAKPVSRRELLDALAGLWPEEGGDRQKGSPSLSAGKSDTKL